MEFIHNKWYKLHTKRLKKNWYNKNKFRDTLSFLLGTFFFFSKTSTWNDLRRNPTDVRATRGQKPCTKIIYIVLQTSVGFFETSSQNNSFLTTLDVENECWTSYETIESFGETKRMMKFCLCFHKISGLWNLFSLVPEGNYFRCYFRQLFMYLALRKCKNYCKILKITLVQIFVQ